MRKKKGTIATLALASAIVVSGAVGLHVSMAHDMQKEQVTEVEQNLEISTEMSTEETAQADALQEETTQTDAPQEETSNQVWLDDESIYLPEGAEIVSKNEYSHEISWDNYDICYKHYSNETQEDLGLGKLKTIIEETIEKYAGQDLGECYMEIFLEDPAAYEDETQDNDVDYDPDINFEEIADNAGEDGVVVIETADGVTTVIETENGVATVVDSYTIVVENESMPEEVRDMYTLDSKCYQVHILTDNQRYDIWVDSLTGEVTVFHYEDETLGTFTNGWDISYEADAAECQLSDEEQKEYDAIIENFISDDLKLGNVEKIYSQYADVSYNGVSGNNIRAYYTVVCKTDEGAVVEVSFDIGEKIVTSFRTSVQYLSE